MGGGGCTPIPNPFPSIYPRIAPSPHPKQNWRENSTCALHLAPLPFSLVETEANGDSQSTNEGVLPWLVRWALHSGAIKAGQAVVQGRLSLQVTF
jgi:hypothetical protein